MAISGCIKSPLTETTWKGIGYAPLSCWRLRHSRSWIRRRTIAKKSSATPEKGGDIKKGDKVKVIRTFKQGTKTKGYQYAGGTFVCWYSVYDVIQVKGDRVVIGIGSTVTAAVNMKDLAKA